MDLDPNTPSKYWYIILIEYIILLIPVFLVLRRYGSFKKLPLYAYISVYVGWYISMMIILLLPIDITNSSFTNCLKEHNTKTLENQLNDLSSSSMSEHDISTCKKPLLYLPETFTKISWNVLYWVSFVMCWLVYPLMQNYSTSGEFNFTGKLKDTIKENVCFYSVLGAVGVAFLILYVVVTKSFNLFSLCKALSNAWGLCLLILTLGYGLVTVPKKVWHRSSVKKRISKYYFDVGKAKGKLNNAREDLFKVLCMLKSYDTYMDTSDPYRKYVDVIISKAPPSYNSPNITCSTDDPRLDYKKIVSLHYKVMFYTHEYDLCYDLYMKAVRKAIDAEDIIKCMDNGENNISWTTKRQQSSIISKLQWLLLCHLRNPLLKTISILLVLFSLIVIWSECIFSVDKPVMSIFALMISPEKVRSSDIYVTLTLFGPLLYLIVCSYWSLFQLRIFRYYRLIPGQHSDANSIIFSAAYLCRLAAPLALNFIHMLKLEGTMFQEVMSSMTEIPIIGNSLFNEYAPVALILVCAFFLFDVLGRVSMCCDCTKYSYSDPLLNDTEIEYGKTIVCDERRLWTNGTHKDSTTENLGDLETGKLVPKREHTPEPTSKYMAKMFGNSRPTIDEKDLSDEENMESGSTNSGRYSKQGGFKRGGGWKKIS